MPKNRMTIGPYSRPNALSSIDGRTRPGRFIKAVQDDLTDHVGGTPTVAQALLIRLVAIKALRLALLTDRILDPEAIAESNDQHFLGWANSLRRDLAELGIERRGDLTPSLAEVLGAAR